MAKKKKKGGKACEEKLTPEQRNLELGREIARKNLFFSDLICCLGYEESGETYRGAPYGVCCRGAIHINENALLTPGEWAYGLIECRLHLGFGHFDADNMPGYEVESEDGTKKKVVKCDTKIWNLACDAYIARYLSELKFGEGLERFPFLNSIKKSADEREIYDYLVETGIGAAFPFRMDMEGLDAPVPSGEEDCFVQDYPIILARCALAAVSVAGGHEEERGYSYRNMAEGAASWFINHYPLLGSLASSFQIIMDAKTCMLEDVQVAAVNSEEGIIYVNPAAGLDKEEMKFVLAHEYLHAGLQHGSRCQGRDPFLWNVACDYVVNGWLVEMEIGRMPKIGILYDETLKGMSAEEIYDQIVTDIRTFSRLDTLRGYGKGDIMRRHHMGPRPEQGVALDEFYKNALRQGLEYTEKEQNCGYIPAGLVQEIRALSMPPIPWDVQLARWFEEHFPLPEPRRTYARPSRRQGATPDIPRPRYVRDVVPSDLRTFGVVMDTSGSVSAEGLGMALGSIASYAVAREVLYVRVVFCDADAYDAGYLAPEDIAGRVKVKGRGGTSLQPGINLLETAKDFPKDGPILVITDGLFNGKLEFRHEHAFLIPKGRRLPFQPKGKVFCFE